MRSTTVLITAASTIALIVAAGATPVRAGDAIHRLQDHWRSTCRQGVIAWMPLAPEPKCGYVQLPQVKVFDATGRLRFIGSALDAIQWAKAGQPRRPIPKDVTVRDAATEARLTQVAAPPPGHGWVTYYVGEQCPPCRTQLATFRAEVLQTLGPATDLTVLQLD